MNRVWIFYLALCVILVGCVTIPGTSQAPATFTVTQAADSRGQAPTDQPTTTTESQNQNPQLTTQKSPELPQLPPDLVIEFTKSGGFKGVIEAYNIYGDGRVITADGLQWQTDPVIIMVLVGKLLALDFFSFQPSYMPVDTCCDRIEYTLTLHYQGKQLQVKTLTATPDTPEELWRSIAIVQEFIDSLTE